MIRTWYGLRLGEKAAGHQWQILGLDLVAAEHFRVAAQDGQRLLHVAAGQARHGDRRAHGGGARGPLRRLQPLPDEGGDHLHQLDLVGPEDARSPGQDGQRAPGPLGGGADRDSQVAADLEPFLHRQGLEGVIPAGVAHAHHPGRALRGEQGLLEWQGGATFDFGRLGADGVDHLQGAILDSSYEGGPGVELVDQAVERVVQHLRNRPRPVGLDQAVDQGHDRAPARRAQRFTSRGRTPGRPIATGT